MYHRYRQLLAVIPQNHRMLRHASPCCNSVSFHDVWQLAMRKSGCWLKIWAYDLLCLLFCSYRGADKRDYQLIEHLLRKGKRQLDMLRDSNVSNVSWRPVN